jgi:AraC family transcriptional regulator of adaptative response / DNA-3-methyladenine glycosylase II
VTRIPYRPPFAFPAILAFLRARALPGIEFVDESTYRRGEVVVRNDAPSGELIVEGGQADRVRRLFDVAADPVAIGAHLKRDRQLASRVAKLPGVRVPGAWDPFELGVRAIVGQQVSVAAATTIMGRIAARYGENGLLSPKRLMSARGIGIGMPRSRWAAVRAFARAAASGSLFLQRTSLDESIAALTAIRGIGPWTANYIAMRAMREPDAFPAGDLGLRRAMANVSDRELHDRAERWRPWRAYAAMLLWQT